jgi:signal transduction histidine kinase
MPAADAPQRLKTTPVLLLPMRLGSLVLAVVLLAATGVIGIVTVQRMKESRELVLHTYRVRGLLKDLRSEIDEIHANFDLYLLAKSPKEISQLEQQSQDELLILADLGKLTIDNPAQQQRLQPIQSLLRQDIDQLQACVKEPDCPGAQVATRTNFLLEVAGRRRSMSAMLRDMEGLEETLLQGRLKTWDRLFVRMIITSIGSFSLALLLLLYNFRLLFREVERGKAQELIEKNNAESYRMLSGRILELQDVERRKIARELHDSVGQFLAGLKINLARLHRREAVPGVESHPLLLESIELTDRAIGEVRTISHLLHPPLLDELGLYSAARWYTEGFAKRSGIQVELNLAEIVDRLPKEIELALFRVLQESLTNVHRHAKATRVTIDIQCTDDDVILFVCDDGRGIKPDALLRFRAGQAGGIGLAGMRERLAELGGTLEVVSSPEGTQIRATVPTNECDPTDVHPENISISSN